VPEVNRGFLSIKRHNFEEKVICILSQKPGSACWLLAALVRQAQLGASFGVRPRMSFVEVKSPSGKA